MEPLTLGRVISNLTGDEMFDRQTIIMSEPTVVTSETANLVTNTLIRTVDDVLNIF